MFSVENRLCSSDMILTVSHLITECVSSFLQTVSWALPSSVGGSTFTQVLHFSTSLRYLCVTWVFPFYTFLYFTTFLREIFYFSLHYIYLTAAVSSYFANWTFKYLHTNMSLSYRIFVINYQTINKISSTSTNYNSKMLLTHQCISNNNPLI